MSTPWKAAIAGTAVVVLLAGCASAPQQAANNPIPRQPPQVRELHLFTSALDFNETALGLPHDIFFPAWLIVNEGDTVQLQYHNTEDADEHHTFTMGAPFDVDRDLGPGEELNVTLSATTPGAYAYRCTYHQPTMTGYLVVLAAGAAQGGAVP
jgi:plastocyanin